MNITVYRQSYKTKPNGTVVYKGEDARPYVDGQLLMIADGMGGASAIRHRKFNPDIFDKEKIMQALFQGTYEDYSDATFVKYVLDSFFEFFAVKDCYTESAYNMKKGGYFASRIVTAIVLHEFLYNKEMSAESVLKKLGNAGSETELNEQLGELNKYFSEKIRKEIRSIARNANFVLEAALGGMALLGTTLCATLYYETEDYVDALYLTAGDSRPYVWSCQDGLSQLLVDEEGPNGGMTNYICANDDKSFNIRCNYFRFKKPCVLFNASDGCFDSSKFISQLAFEKTIMDSAMASDSPEAFSEALTDFFVEYGQHDDSSTIAMKLFGFESFDAFKEQCFKRSAVIQKEYIAVMPDVLDVDYEVEYEECEDALHEKMATIKEKIQAEKGVIEYCTDYVRSGKYAPYAEKVNEYYSKIEAQKEKIGVARNKIETVISRNFIKFEPYLEQGKRRFDGYCTTKIHNAEQKYEEYATEYLAAVQGLREKIDASVQELNEMLDIISEIGIPYSFDDFNDIDYNIAKDCEKNIHDLFEFLAGLRNQKNDILRKIMQQRSEYTEWNIKLAQKYPEVVKALSRAVESGRIQLDEVQMSIEDMRDILLEIDKISLLCAEINSIDTEIKTVLLNDMVKTFWEKNYIEIIPAIIKDESVEINNDVREEAIAIFDEYIGQTKDIKEKCELQKQLFAKYDETYSMYMGVNAE